MNYLCNIDIGGTHTDGVVIDEEGSIAEIKVPSTPDEFSRGFFDALDAVADEMGLSQEELLRNADLVSHGTTVGTNTVIEETETDAVLITTPGTEDVLFITRGAPGRSSGLPIEEVLRYQTVSKPDPIIEHEHIYSIDERIDCMGDTVVEFDEEGAYEVANHLAEQDIDSVGINFLWSFLEDDHERRMESILEEVLDDEVFLTRSSELVPKQGEYERMAAVAMNASIGPVTSEYITKIDEGLKKRGYDGMLLVMFVGGGTAPSSEAVREPVRTIDSGPAAGLIGCRYLADILGHEDVIAADMGGTSFDVGLIRDGETQTNPENVVNQYDYKIRNIDVESIGSGGGSIAWIEEETERLEVGPKSAGANPGPACYGRGGTDATITDADLLLGFLDPDSFLGGEMTLDRGLAVEAIESIGETVGMDPEETAMGILQLANAKMGDLVRQRTINRGYDPRDFIVYAYGGAGPLHLPMMVDQLHIDTVVVPGGSVSSVWSAFGLSSSDVLHRQETSNIRTFAPFDPDSVTEQFEEIEASVRDKLYADGFDDEDIRLERYGDLRYGMQVHQLSVPVASGTLSEADLETMIADFETEYDSRYGEGAGASHTGFELVALRVDGYGVTTKPQLAQTEAQSGSGSPATSERILWPNEGRELESDVYYEEDIASGQQIDGPAVARMDNTTVGIPPNSTCTVDRYNNFEIKMEDS